MVDLKGFGSEGFIINLVLSILIIWHVYLKPKIMKKPGKDRRKPTTNPHPAPGNGVECKQHSKDLIEAKTEIKNIKSQTKDYDKKNREDHQLMFEKIDKLKNSRR